MTPSEIFDTITGLFRTMFDEYDGPVTLELNAARVEQWDSLANVQFMVMVEQAFKFRFATDEITKLKNLDDLASLVATKIDSSKK